MRVSSVICPASSSGTLKSTRTSARFPRTCVSSRSLTVFLRIVRLESLAHKAQHIDATRSVAPFVVVPALHRHEGAIDDVGSLRVENARSGIADEIRGHQLLIRVAEDSLQWTGRRRFLECVVDRLLGGPTLLHFDSQYRIGDIGR